MDNGLRTTDYRLQTTDNEVPHLNSHFNMNKVSENPFKNRATSNTPLMLVTAVFATLYLVSNVMAVKVVCFFDYPTFDAGTITFPFAYMLGDVLTEIWGYRTAKKVIWITFVCNIILVACTQIGVWLPSPDYLQETANAYNHLFPPLFFFLIKQYLCNSRMIFNVNSKTICNSLIHSISIYFFTKCLICF